MAVWLAGHTMFRNKFIFKIANTICRLFGKKFNVLDLEYILPDLPPTFWNMLDLPAENCEARQNVCFITYDFLPAGPAYFKKSDCINLTYPKVVFTSKLLCNSHSIFWEYIKALPTLNYFGDPETCTTRWAETFSKGQLMHTKFGKNG